MVGYFKVRRKNYKLQSKLIMWARKKSKIQIQKKRYIHKGKKKQKQNPIYSISSKN